MSQRTYVIPLCPDCGNPMRLKQVKNPKGWREGRWGPATNGAAPQYKMVWKCWTDLHKERPEEDGYPEGWEFEEERWVRQTVPLDSWFP